MNFQNKPLKDGVIQYDRSNYTETPALPYQEYIALERWRRKLYQRALIGEYPKDKVGYGNISERRDLSKYFSRDLQFVISGTQTGKYPDLNGMHYTRVVDSDIEQLKVVTMGPLEASSETMTHASIYEQNSHIRAIFHIHNEQIWQKMIEQEYPSTSRWIPYGTLEMALAVKKCVKDSSQGVFVMKGHKDGVIAYGPSLSATANIIRNIYSQFISKECCWE